MLIINKKYRAVERAQQWKALDGLPHCVCQYLTHVDHQLLITSRSRVLRPSYDISKEETYDIHIHTHSKILFIQTFQKNHKCEEVHHTPGIQGL